MDSFFNGRFLSYLILHIHGKKNMQLWSIVNFLSKDILFIKPEIIPFRLADFLSLICFITAVDLLNTIVIIY